MDLEKISHDLTEAEVSAVQDYTKNGCPGLVKIGETDIFSWFELYMVGKSYSEIAKQTKSKKDMVMYIAVKSNWHTKRLEYYTDLANNLLNKYQQAKSNSANTVANMVSALNKYYGDRFDQFLATNDRSIIDGIDTKMLAQYYKAIEMLDKLMGAAADKTDKPIVNVNVGSNAKVTQIDENNMDIEIDESNIGDILKYISEKSKKT